MTTSVKVAVRVRPFSPKEVTDRTNKIIEMDGPSTIITDPAWFERKETLDELTAEDTEYLYKKIFTFDHSFWSFSGKDEHFSSQEDVFNSLGSFVLDNALNAFNCSIFAYGQTGSGKSYSMMGTGGEMSRVMASEQRGLIPRICEALFNRVGGPKGLGNADGTVAKQKKSEDDSNMNDMQWNFAVTYLEIYQERVYDLLSSADGNINDVDAPRNLRIREHPTRGAYAEGLNECIVTNYKDVEDYIHKGSKARTVASTNMNLESSRSHAVFTIILKSRSKEKGLRSDSCVRLVDLAGSERAKKSGATGERLKEGSNINKSLSALSEVIKALAKRSEYNRKRALGEGGSADDGTTNFIPYRNSTLTWLLKESLGGNAKTVMLATVSPADYHYEETLSTLKYVERAKKIVSNVTQNQIRTSSEQIAMLKKEVERLKAQLRSADMLDDDLDVVEDMVEETGTDGNTASISSYNVRGKGRYGVLIKEINETKERYKKLRVSSENDLKLKKEAYRKMIEKLRAEHEEEESGLKKRFKDAMKETQDLYKGEISSAIQTIQDLKLEVSSQARTIDLQSKTIHDLGQNDARDYGQDSDEDALQVFGKKYLILENKVQEYEVQIEKSSKELNKLKCVEVELKGTIHSHENTISDLQTKLAKIGLSEDTVTTPDNTRMPNVKIEEMIKQLEESKNANKSLRDQLLATTERESMQRQEIDCLKLQVSQLSKEKDNLNLTASKYSTIIEKMKEDMNNTIMGTVTTMRGEFNEEIARIAQENSANIEEIQRKSEKRLEKERKDHRKSEEMLQDTIIGLTKKVKEASNKVVESERRHEQQIAEWEERLLKAQMQTAEAMNFQVAVSRGEKDWSWVQKASSTVKKGIQRYTGQEEEEL